MNKELSQDLRLFAEHLSVNDFKALSDGIGLGVKAVNNKTAFQAQEEIAQQKSVDLLPMPPSQLAHSQGGLAEQAQSTSQALPSLPSALSTPSKNQAKAGASLRMPAPLKQGPRFDHAKSPGKQGAGSSNLRQAQPGTKRLLLRLMAGSLDLLIVAFSFIATFFTFFYLMEPATLSWKMWVHGLITRWLRLFSLHELMLGLVVMMGGYLLLFRIFAGATLGELFLGVRKSKTMLKE